MFACIYVPDFPVEAIVRVEPWLREQAVAVLEGKPPLVRVVALNEKARCLGMEVGMTKLQAAVFSAPANEATHSSEASVKNPRLRRSSFLPGARKANRSLVWRSCASAQSSRRTRPMPRCSTLLMLLRRAWKTPPATLCCSTWPGWNGSTARLQPWRAIWRRG